MFGLDPLAGHALSRLEHRIRLVIATLVPGFALLSLPAILSSEGPADGAPRVVAFIVMATTVPAGLLVAATREGFSWGYIANRNPLGTALFALYADVGVAIVVFTFSDRTMALIGCVLLALVSTYLAYFGSFSMVLAHMAFTSVVIMTLAVLAVDQGEHDAAGVIFRAGVVWVAVNGTVWVTSIATEAFQNMLARQIDRAQTDPLTELLNLRGLQVESAELVQKSTGPLGFMLIDIDKFKAVNDVHGHVVGDTVLVRAAQRLRSHFGSRAVLARRGGEEFAVVMPADIDTLLREAEAVRRVMSDPTDEVHVTVSIGVSVVDPRTVVPPRTATGTTDAIVTHGMHTADMAMYAAKAAGRDRVSVHPDSVGEPLDRRTSPTTR